MKRPDAGLRRWFAAPRLLLVAGIAGVVWGATASPAVSVERAPSPREFLPRSVNVAQWSLSESPGIAREGQAVIGSRIFRF